jgi:general secretion pathway protein A
MSTALLVNPTLSREEFLEAVLDEFEVPCSASSKPKRLAALHEHLLQVQRRGGASILIVDEAHLLDVDLLEETRLLSNLDTYGEKLLQIVICGQPELDEMLRSPRLAALRQRIAIRSRLRELSSEETRAYIAQRLHIAGLRGALPFTPNAVAAIHKYSAGVPRVINLLCDKCLGYAFEAHSKTVVPDVVHMAAEDLDLTSLPPALSRQAVANGDVAGILPVAMGSHGKKASVADID